MKAYLRGGPLVIRGTGEQTRDFIHVDDITLAIVAFLDAPNATIAGELFQIGIGQETSLRELADTIFRAGGHEVPIVHEPPSPGDVPRNVSDISRARRVLGYEPRVELRQGLASTLEWFRGRSRADMTR
jgi:UDP-glucose 4-epimerase